MLDMYQSYLAVWGRLVKVPKGFTTCDACDGIVWDGELINEVVVAPGQTSSADGRGQWQGAVTCANCTALTHAAFMSVGGECTDCGQLFGIDHECAGTYQLSDHETQFRDHRFWEARTKYLDTPRIVVQMSPIIPVIEVENRP